MMLGRVLRRLRTKRRWKLDVKLIESSPLFDRAYYLDSNPDVVAAGVNPVVHYLNHGVAENRNPSAQFDNQDYLRRYPDVAQRRINPLLHYLRHGGTEGRKPSSDALVSKTGEPQTLVRLRAESLIQLRPLRVFLTPPVPRRRLTLLTDSISRGSLFGGVATSIMFAALLAQSLEASLRIVTQTEPAEAGSVMALLRENSIPWDENIEFAFTDRYGAEEKEIDLRSDDLFITTSWWTTYNALAGVPSTQIIYFLQEDERMFYPHDDKHLLCSELMRTPSLRIVVNSQLLHMHLVAEGFESIGRQDLWFEPAFPHATEATGPAEGNKHLFLFYARPSIGRNLFIRGMEAITAALEQNILDPAYWEFCFVGRDLEDICLPRGVIPTLLQSIPWPEYCALVKRVDLGLSLMYTPHPSYPPLDLAAAGAVVVTNQYPPKTSLTQYSPNILCVDPRLDQLVSALAEGAALAVDLPRRRANHALNRLERSWQQSFAPVLKRLVAELS